ncbi:GRAM domain-containing protein 2B-like isoform X1 [Echinops telfairi]|uniref:GRAM domain-containing protein 2B-like isoform X1 n=1 Tax=Echinops telfairi TaxID=9371 RepID=A0AC55CLI5_ECHTE|nr:GRAM domain-containing protein 2B-like isoform X1 [Echinops telfairi]
MVKKRLSSSDTAFPFESPHSPTQALPEAAHSSTDSPGSVIVSSEAENGVEERKKVCRSPTALSPTLSVEAETQDQRRLVSQRVRRAAAISPAS